MLVLFVLLFGVVSSSISSTERIALVELFHSTGGRNWYIREGWLVDDPCCEQYPWFGVNCDCIDDWELDCHVTEIILYNNNLNGAIPDTIRYLTYLRTLNLYNNHITGNIPANIGSLTYLEVLDLGNNKFTGSIPNSVSALTKLEILSFSSNRLSHTIPAGIFSSLTLLKELYLYDNILTGTIPPFGLLSYLSVLLITKSFKWTYNSFDKWINAFDIPEFI
jgi:Leucine-rich repeat (LRR) protein